MKWIDHLFGRRVQAEPVKWTVTHGIVHGRPLVARYRTETPAGIAKEDYPHLVSIVWRYEPSNEAGMPCEADDQSMTEMEDLLDPAIEVAGEGFLTVVVTTDGRREWMWQARNAEAFQRLMNDALKGRPIFPLDITRDDSPDWGAYEAFRGLR